MKQKLRLALFKVTFYFVRRTTDHRIKTRYFTAAKTITRLIDRFPD